MKRQDRGASLLVALAFVVIVVMMLGVAAQGYARLSESHRAGLAEEAALLEARSGVRWMAVRGTTLERTDVAGTLRVVAAGGRIVSTFTDGTRTVILSARWNKETGILDDWKDE